MKDKIKDFYLVSKDNKKHYFDYLVHRTGIKCLILETESGKKYKLFFDKEMNLRIEGHFPSDSASK